MGRKTKKRRRRNGEDRVGAEERKRKGGKQPGGQNRREAGRKVKAEADKEERGRRTEAGGRKEKAKVHLLFCGQVRTQISVTLTHHCKRHSEN